MSLGSFTFTYKVYYRADAEGHPHVRIDPDCGGRAGVMWPHFVAWASEMFPDEFKYERLPQQNPD
jgi:hypothetical protein